MKILFCTNSLGAFGGIERATIVKANALSDIDGVEVHICYTDKGTYPEKTIHPISDRVATHDLGVPFWDLYPLDIRNLLVTAPQKFFKLRKALKSLIKDLKPDIVITTGSYEKYALASIKLPDKGVKIREYHFNSDYRSYDGRSALFSIVEFFEYNMLGKAFDKNYLLTREDYEKHFHGNPRFDFQGNPSPFEVQSDISTERENIVVTVCRLAYAKNISALLRIWHKVADKAPGWRLVIAGDGDERKSLEQLSAQLGISKSVDFLGFRNDIDAILKKCKIMALTSRYEGYGLTLIEGMNFGVVPISYRTPYGPADIITDGVNGVLVDYMDEDQFAEKLLTLIDSPAAIAEMSEKALIRSRDFAPEKIARDWMVKYNDLLTKKRSRHR